MNRIRFALAATMLLGTVYAAFGLLISLTDFGIGLAVAAAAMVAYECTVFVEDRRRQEDWMREYRRIVWARRDKYFGQQHWRE